MYFKIYGCIKNKSYNKFCFEDSEKICFMIEELVGFLK